jgi:hypothetical protein
MGHRFSARSFQNIGIRFAEREPYLGASETLFAPTQFLIPIIEKFRGSVRSCWETHDWRLSRFQRFESILISVARLVTEEIEDEEGTFPPIQILSSLGKTCQRASVQN